MKVRDPLSAPRTPPETGASKKEAVGYRLNVSSLTAKDVAVSMVEQSNSIFPDTSEARTPVSGVRYTARA